MRRLIALVALSLFPIATTTAADMPQRKSGLWEIKMAGSEMPMPMVTQQCVDEKTDNLAKQMGDKESEKNCSAVKVRHDGNKVVTESSCKIDKSIATTQGIFTGNFREHYRGEVNTTYAPPLQGMKSSRQTFEAKWLGPCKPGQKPGDVIMPGMGKMNLNEMMKNMPK